MTAQKNDPKESMRERYRKLLLVKACKKGIDALRKLKSDPTLNVTQAISFMEKAVDESGESEEFIDKLDL